MSSLRENYGGHREPHTGERNRPKLPYWVTWIISLPLFAILLLNWWASFDRFMSGYREMYGFKGLPPIIPTLLIIALAIGVHKVAARLSRY